VEIHDAGPMAGGMMHFGIPKKGVCTLLRYPQHVVVSHLCENRSSAFHRAQGRSERPAQ
jgi:hypothetical protein